MRKKYTIITLILAFIWIFLLWRHSYQIELFIEKKFNTFQICNLSEYNIDKIHVTWYLRTNNHISFWDIQPWECSKIKPSFRFWSFFSARIHVSDNKKNYFINRIPTDTFWGRKLNIWHTILEFHDMQLFDNNGKTITRAITRLKEHGTQHTE